MLERSFTQMRNVPLRVAVSVPGRPVPVETSVANTGRAALVRDERLRLAGRRRSSAPRSPVTSGGGAASVGSGERASVDPAPGTTPSSEMRTDGPAGPAFSSRHRTTSRRVSVPDGRCRCELGVEYTFIRVGRTQAKSRPLDATSSPWNAKGARRRARSRRSTCRGACGPSAVPRVDALFDRRDGEAGIEVFVGRFVAGVREVRVTRRAVLADEEVAIRQPIGREREQLSSLGGIGREIRRSRSTPTRREPDVEPPPVAPGAALRAVERKARAARAWSRAADRARPGAAKIAVSAFFGATECAHVGSGTSVRIAPRREQPIAARHLAAQDAQRRQARTIKWVFAGFTFCYVSLAGGGARTSRRVWSSAR